MIAQIESNQKTAGEEYKLIGIDWDLKNVTKDGQIFGFFSDFAAWDGYYISWYSFEIGNENVLRNEVFLCKYIELKLILHIISYSYKQQLEALELSTLKFI